LEKPAQFVRGVGPQRAKLLAGLGIETLGDLVEYFPFRYEDQSRPQPIDSLVFDQPATVIGTIESFRCQGGFRRPTIQARINDSTDILQVTWFNAAYMRDRLTRGQMVRLFGTVTEYQERPQMVNPKVEWLDPDTDLSTLDTQRIVPVYGVTKGLSTGQMTRLMKTALREALPAIHDPLPESIRIHKGFPTRREAVQWMHFPPSMEKQQAARQRLAYEELYLMQLAVSLIRRWRNEHARSIALSNSQRIDRRIRRRFPFELTAAQNRVIEEIIRDISDECSMNRLLQGDVGSGKTVVALYAALVAIANQTQCAILAPTAVLATQHYASIEKYLTASRVKRCLLTGQTSASQRDKMFRQIARGEMNLIVGTQALLEQKVRFNSLGLVIVDEQHKFGVAQRANLRGRKSRAEKYNKITVPHYLVMTATPIPRTLSMTVFGDLDVSLIDQLPPGRQPIRTRVVRPQQEPGAWQEVRRRIGEGDQVYVVYPLVEESDALDLKAATGEVQRVADELLPGARVGLLHGRMKKAEKQQVMEQFARHDLDVLVSTTVIEVGVDVPNATVMVIQNAERYGLSALHQLRGRVGRGNKPSVCMLMTESENETARRRLDVLCQTNNGFRIAEEDLRIRGPGELMGTRQHGWPEFRVANLAEDVDLLTAARDDAALLARKDPRLQESQHVHLKAELRRRFREKISFLDVG
jgi:ATP-dependent DNA helicase RecG